MAIYKDLADILLFLSIQNTVFQLIHISKKNTIPEVAKIQIVLKK